MSEESEKRPVWRAEARPTRPVPFATLRLAWLALVLLTFLGLVLGTWFHGAPWLPVLVAGMIWAKGALVARYFLESSDAHPFIRRLLQGFIALAPLLLLFTTFFGGHLARWTSL